MLVVFFLKIVIEGIRGQSYQGDIAIDDLWIDDSPCPPEGHYFLQFTVSLLVLKLIDNSPTQNKRHLEGDSVSSVIQTPQIWSYFH